jgi:sodium-dependent phosphate transporter
LGTIKNDIISIDAFQDAPSVLMMGMLCALIGSSLFLTFATRIGLPVSTTHCIIGGIIGVGFATVGAEGVDWSWGGVSQVFAAWAIAPCISAAFGAILFLFTKYGVMKAKNPLKVGMFMVPFFYALTSGILTMLIVWKGAASLDLDDWGTAPTVGTIFGVAGAVALLSCIFILPFLHVKLVREDWKLKQYDILKGPFLLRRPDAGPIPAGHELVIDYYHGHATPESLASSAQTGETRSDIESSRDGAPNDSDGISDEKAGAIYGQQAQITAAAPTISAVEPIVPIKRKWYEPAQLWQTFKWTFFRGVMIDIVSEQSQGGSNEPKFIQRLLVGKNLEKKHAIVEHYDLKVEHLYSFLQVMTAATASFAHGANESLQRHGPALRHLPDLANEHHSRRF